MNNTINKKQKSIVPILTDHLKKYPLMKIQDIYKLIYQAAMGPEHLIADKADAYNRFFNELDKINEFYFQSVYENIDPEDKVVRINLGPFKFNNGNPEALFEAFYQTSRTFSPKIENMQLYCKQVYCLAADKKLPFNLKEIQSLFREKASQNFPAVHHSDVYRKSYHPAYRLIDKNRFHVLY
ncbi:MAG: hypothetical protein JW956_00620 [Calditrichaceae bacterium]|nr:hypothetical protein [Calditrichaceae bacterium]